MTNKGWVMGSLLAVPLIGACSFGPDYDVVDEADAGGVGFESSHEVVADSLRVRIEVTNNTDTSADITLNGGCSITVILREDEKVVWDEREGNPCADEDRTVPMAPHEEVLVFHTVPVAAIDGGVEDREVLTRVLVAIDKEYILRSDG